MITADNRFVLCREPAGTVYQATIVVVTADDLLRLADGVGK